MEAVSKLGRERSAVVDHQKLAHIFQAQVVYQGEEDCRVRSLVELAVAADHVLSSEVAHRYWRPRKTAVPEAVADKLYSFVASAYEREALGP